MDKKLNNLITFENVLKITPPLFLFYSFMYLNTYSQFFDLAVSNIYDLSEIFLVFLPIVDILMPLAILFIIFWGLLLFFKAVHGKPILFYLRPKWVVILAEKDTRNKYKGIWKCERVVLYTIFRLLLNSTTILFAILLFMTGYLKRQLEVDIMGVIISGLIFIFLTHDVIRAYNNYFPQKARVPRLPVKFPLMLTSLLVFYIFTKNLAIAEAQHSVKEKSYSVSFVYDGVRHTTNSDTICVLESKKFFVFRSLTTSKNFPFEKDKISGLVTGKSH